ncbi:TIGR04104 family putative zinc finger protein [Rummeliibacillus suwonensis]|uniref:TIGR04104 family putative zinc finger protein n=1 Tax=Rummeliibacillus suwonensis TaxID=1306154 RepID=UPI0035E3D7C5
MLPLKFLKNIRIEGILMNMPICQHCGHKWSWRETFFQMTSFKRKLKCSNCHSYQYISVKSRNLISLFGILITSIYVPLVSFNFPLWSILTVGLLTYVLLLLCVPFIIKLSNKEEALW